MGIISGNLFIKGEKMLFQLSNKSMETLNDVPDSMEWKTCTILSPQHLQQLSKRYDNLIKFALSLPSSYQWGLTHCNLEIVQIEEKDNSISRLLVNELEAIMPNGEPVIYYKTEDIETSDKNQLSLDLDFENNNTVNVYLGVYRQGFRNPIEKFFDQYSENYKDYYREADEIDISFIKPKLLLTQQKLSERDCCFFQIARIIKKEEHISFDPIYCPPSVFIDKESIIANFCHDVTETIRKKIQEHENTANMNAETKITLHHLFSSLPVLEVMLNSTRLDPYNIYLALSSIAGNIGILSPQRRFPVLKFYNHNDMYTCFDDIVSFIKMTVENCFFQNYDIFEFEKTPNDFNLDISPNMFIDDEYLLIGVDNKTPRIQDWMKECKIMDEEFFKSKKFRGDSGAIRKEMTQKEIPDDLDPPRSIYLYKILAERFVNKKGKLIISPPPKLKEFSPPKIKLYKKRV